MGSRFEGQMLEFRENVIERMNRMEKKLDDSLDNTKLTSVVISGVVGVIIAVIGYFSTVSGHH